MEEFPAVFNGLGHLGEEYEIKIKPEAKPYALYSPRDVPLPLRKRVQEEWNQWEWSPKWSKLDANSGFWQIPLAQQSRLLTTFITPYGRFCFNKLPFGISSAPEHFQKWTSKILSGLEGVVCQVDDVLVFGEDKKEHDSRLRDALQRIKTAGATLNPKKCEFEKSFLAILPYSRYISWW